MRLYWWDHQPNFGDRLSAVLYHSFSGRAPEWAPPAEAEMVIVGSVLDVLPVGWSGIIAGAGKLHATTRLELSRARVLGLRGKLSARGVPGDYVLGDPGLLADEFVQVNTEYDLGVVAHWTDNVLAKRFAHLGPRVIASDQDPLTVVAEIGRCKKIVSSSLHGIVVADAFGIPRRTERSPRAYSSPEGGDFKFADYASVVGVPMVVGQLQLADRHRIHTLQGELFEMMERLARMTNAET